MNHCYRLVWSTLLNRLVPAPETARGRGRQARRRTRAVAAACISLLGATAWAGPTGGTVSAGSGSIAQSGKTTTVTQASQNLAVNWTSFSVASGETVNFVQPNRQSIVLNRVTGREASVIDGALQANGQVWLLNAQGVLFGRNASVNVGGLVASTLGMNDAEFMAGKTRFTTEGAAGMVENQGSLSGGYVALLGPQVRNTGRIQTPGGTSALAAGDAVTLSFAGGALLSVQVDAGTYAALVDNRGLIQADDGHVLMSATAKDALLSTVVNNSGVIQARGLSTDGGTIKLLAGGDGGTVTVGGTLDASSTAHNGGFIETSGPHVQVGADARLSTLSGSGRTGTWLLDPTDFTISAGSSAQTTSGIGATTLNTQLASNNVTLATAVSGSDAGNLYVNAPVSWSANTTLTLTAANDIYLNSPITATGSSAGLVLNFGGDYRVSAPITLSGSSATLSINSQAYTLIRSMAQLDALDGASGRYALAQDLDASGTTYTNSVVSGGFSGTFTGLGHTVSGLTINAPSIDHVGLFGDNSGTLRDLGVVGGSVTGHTQVGALLGFNNFGVLSNVYATSNVTGTGIVDAGGLLGFNEQGTVTRAYATGNVTGLSSVGGLAGFNRGSMREVYATGNVTGSGDNVGGLLGYQTNGTVSDAYASGNVHAAGQNAGGLLGYNNTSGSSITRTVATGQVSAGSGTGGLVGYNFLASISNSYWDSGSTGQGAATGTSVGGSVTNTVALNSGTAFAHGNYANLGTWSESVTGSGVWVANGGSGNTWVMVEGGTRPLLVSEYSTYIRNAHQLQLMALDLSARYTLAQDIDASATSCSNAGGLWSSNGFAPVGNSTSVATTFTGSLDGQSHQISGLGIARSGQANVGLIGYNAGSVQDITLNGGSVSGAAATGALVGLNLAGGRISGASASTAVTGNNWGTGGLVGRNEGSVSNSSASGTVQGNVRTGGLVGDNWGGTITGSHASGSVNAALATGGLVGHNGGDGTMAMPMSSIVISNSYATGSVTGSGNNTGGLVGEQRGTVSNAYSTGHVSGAAFVGGLAGENQGSSTDVYATGGVSVGGSYAGGLIGDNAATGTVLRGYSTGTVTGSLGGGLIGRNNGAITDSFWLSSVKASGFGFTAGTVSATTRGLTNTQAQSASTYANAGWSIASDGGSSATWRIYEGQTSPLLRNFLSALTVTAGSGGSKTYDGSTVTSLGVSYSLTPGSQLLGTAVVQTASKNVGTQATTVTGLYSTQQGYDLSIVGGSTAITPATLGVSGTVAASKVYDGSTTASLSGGALTGTVYGSDAVSLVQTGSFADKNVGSAKTVTISSALTGADAGNYVLASASSLGSANITPATLGVSGTVAASKVYDGSTTASLSGGALTGTVYGSDAVSLVQTGSFADKNVGSAKTVTISNTLAGADAGNYVLASASSLGSASITPKALNAAIVATDKTYDGRTDASTQGTLSGVVSGDTVTLNTSGQFADKNAGSGKTVNLLASLSGSDAGNYTLASNTTALANITPKSVSAAIVAADKTYDGLTNTATQGTLSGVVSGDMVTLNTSGQFADKSAGGGKTVNLLASLSGSDAGNYTLTSNTTALASVTPKLLTVSANDATKTVDGRPYRGGNGVSYDGLVTGDTAATLSGSLVYGGTAQGAVTAGSYTLEVSGLSSGNYSIRYLSGRLLITGASVGDVDQARQVVTQQNSPVRASTAHESPAGLAVYERQADGGVNATRGNSVLRVLSCGVSLDNSSTALCNAAN